MRQHRYAALRPVTALLLAILAGACASSRGPGGAPPADRSVITAAQLGAQHFENAYEAVASLRANWLQERGPDSFQNPTRVVVYLDNVRLGDVETLRTVSVR